MTQQPSSISERIPRIPECITVFIAGPVASGKTFFTKQLVDRMERSLIVDNGANYLDPQTYEHVWSNPKQLADRLATNSHYYRIAYHPQSRYKMEEFHWCFASIWTLKEPRWIIVEEAHEFCSVNAIVPDMETILRYSRHNLLGVIATSQRIADVDKLLTGMARMTVLFNTQEYRDIEAAKLRWGKKVSDALEKLRPCIYNDLTEECEQEPECLIITKQGFNVVSLGDKVKTNTEENQWQNSEEREELTTPEVQFSEHASGKVVQKSPESLSKDSQPD